MTSRAKQSWEYPDPMNELLLSAGGGGVIPHPGTPGLYGFPYMTTFEEDLYSEVQPLDFSTRKRREEEEEEEAGASPDHSSDSERCCSLEDDVGAEGGGGGGGGGAVNLVLDRKMFWSRSSESGVSSSTSPDLAMGSSTASPPDCVSPMVLSPPHHHPLPPPYLLPGPHHQAPPAAAHLLAQLHAHSLLYPAYPFTPYLSPARDRPGNTDLTPPAPTVHISPLTAGHRSPKTPPSSSSTSSLGPGGLAGGWGRGPFDAGLREEDANSESEAYSRFRQRMLSQVAAAKARRAGDRSSSNNPHARRPQLKEDLGEEMMETGLQDAGGGGGGGGGEDQPKNGNDSSSPSKSKAGGSSRSNSVKDEAYWERRRKNNEAAKRSRDARRAKEDEIAIRAAFLEQENLKLRVEVASLKSETAKLRCLLYNS